MRGSCPAYIKMNFYIFMPESLDSVEKGKCFMRVITGSARGRRLETPNGDDVRPTADAVKESVFSIIQFDIEGCVFLDAFAGSGQMGIEAVSRGAEKAYFIDNSKKSLNMIKRNIEICGFGDKTQVRASDTISFMAGTREKFDIVFLDPPYGTGLLQRALELAPGVTKSSGYIICEHPREEKLPQSAGCFRLKKSYRYGKIMISIYAVPDEEQEVILNVNSDLPGKL